MLQRPVSRAVAAPRAAAVVAGAVLAGTLLRLHFLYVPLNTDEGGYAAIAHLWASGQRLYGATAWVDRPQGMLVLFRSAEALGGDAAIRGLAIAAAALATAAVASAAWTLAGPRAGAAAAVLFGVLSPAPHLEGFTANGELLGGALGAAGVAAALLARRSGRDALFVVAGAFAASAPLVKQSAADGAVVVLVVAICAARGERRARPLAALVAGVALPLVPALAHAAATGIGDWWYAIVGYRTGTESAVSDGAGTRLQLLADSVPPALGDLAPLLALAVPGLVAARRGRHLLVPATWLGAAALGFLAGGLYHPHYWIQLVPPLAVAAGIGLDAVLDARGRVRSSGLAALAIALACTVAYSAKVYGSTSPSRTSRLTSSDDRLLTARRVGAALRAASGPRDRVFVVWANAVVYWYADRLPLTRYLWYRGLQRIPGALPDALADLNGPHPPAAIAVYQDVRALDPSGSVARLLATRYVRIADIGGVPVYRLRR